MTETSPTVLRPDDPPSFTFGSPTAATIAVLWLTLSIHIAEATASSDIRLVIYALPLIVLALAAFPKAGVRFSPSGRVVFLGVAATLALALLGNLRWDNFAMRNSVFVLMCFSLLTLRTYPREWHLAVALLTMLSGTLVLYLVRGGPSPTDDGGTFSTGLMESSYGLAAAAICVYYFNRRNLLWGFLALAIAILLFKRTAILGAFTFGVFPLFLPSSVRNMRLPFPLLAATSGLIAFAGLQANRIAEWLHHILDLSLSVNAYTLGRFAYNSTLEAVMGDASLLQRIFGLGPGAAERQLSLTFGVNGVVNIQPHNDFLRILFDYGWCGLTIFIIGLCWIFRSTPLLQKVLLFQMLLFLTDNTLVYLFHFVVLGLILSAELARKRQTS